MKKFLLYGFVVLAVLALFFYNFFDLISEFYFGTDNSSVNPRGEMLKLLSQIFGAIILLLGAYQAYRTVKSMDTSNKLVEQGNIAERFKDAVGMLDNDNTNTRLGGIYALDNIAKYSKEYREQVFNILLAFINNKTKNLPSWNDLPLEQRFTANPSIEVQTILKLIFSQEVHIYRDFRGAFYGAKLYGGDFSKMNFSRCTFKNVEFQNSNFTDTWLIKSIIYNSDFTYSIFFKAIFTGADISCSMPDNTIFAGCYFGNTRFIGCRIQQTDFSFFIQAYFEGVNITSSSFDGCRISSAFGDGTFNGASIGNVTIRGMQCQNQLIAKGARFGFGIFGSKSIEVNMNSLIGVRLDFRSNNNIEEFPLVELDRYKSLDEYTEDNWNNAKIPDYSFRCTLELIRRDPGFKPTGWQFTDDVEFTEKDYKKIVRLYNDDIEKLDLKK